MRTSGWVSRAAFASAVFLTVGGCYSGVDPSAQDGDSEGDDDDDGADVGDVDKLCEEGPFPGPLPRMVRLTHEQYDATVDDLLGGSQTPSDNFLGDPSVAGFTNNAQALVVTDRLARDYRRAAEELAGAFVADADRLAAVVSCDPSSGDASCAEQFIRDFGRRAYRRPLTEAELDKYGQLYASAAGLYDSGSNFEQGIRLVTEAFLQSPHFLYRVEMSSEIHPDDENLVPLSGYEIASRLSYLLWNTTPHDEMLDAAEAGDLDTAEGVEAWARAMLADPRAEGPLMSFHSQWLELDEMGDLQKDPEQFQGWHSGMSDILREETERFIKRVAFETEGTYADLLTSNVSYVNYELAAIYGLSGDYAPDEFVEVELPAGRAGLLTQPGFLASHAYFDVTSPIHRGVFVQRQLLCASIPEPPGDVDTNLPPLDGDLKTTRDRVEAHTSPQACNGCHQMINAPGYALEGFNAIGQVRSTDNGEPVNTASSMLIGADMVEVDGAVDLANEIASSEVGARCYLVNWFRYANMRRENTDDQCTINSIHELMLESNYDIKELMVALTQTATFRFRSPKEVE